jgi:hypothetical protein
MRTAAKEDSGRKDAPCRGNFLSRHDKRDFTAVFLQIPIKTEKKAKSVKSIQSGSCAEKMAKSRLAGA